MGKFTSALTTYDNQGIKQTNALTNASGPLRTEQYGYDEQYRLKTVDYGDGQTQSYAFDAMGNRTQRVDSAAGTDNYTYNAANMLLTRGANSYTNDSNGNTLTGGGRTNTWDSENRLVQCVNGATTSTFTYGGDGQRRRLVSGGNTTDYLLDNNMFVRELRNGTLSATYLVGPHGPEYRRDDSAGTIRWYVYDGLGSVLGEVDPNGNLTASRSYDVYGAVRTSAGTSTSKHKFVGNLGHPSEDETGLIYMRARYMDPVTGRFINEDPAKNGENWFLYCGNNPVVNVDPDGRLSISQLFLMLAGLYTITGMLGVNLAKLLWSAVNKLIVVWLRARDFAYASFERANDTLEEGAWGDLGAPGVYAACYLADAFIAIGTMTVVGATIALIAAIHTAALIGAILLIDQGLESADEKGWM